MHRSVYKDRQFEIDALRSTKPVKTGKSNSPPINGQCTSLLLYDGPLLCGYNVAIKELSRPYHNVVYMKAAMSQTIRLIC